MADMMRLAVPEDWPLIESWRAAHFAEMRNRQKVPRETCGQKEFDQATWIVWERHGKPAAALSFTQDDEQRIRWAHDLYGAPSCGLAGLKLVEAFEEYCDQTGYEIRGDTDPENVEYLKLVELRSYEIVSIGFRRRPRPIPSEPLPTEESHVEL